MGVTVGDERGSEIILRQIMGNHVFEPPRSHSEKNVVVDQIESAAPELDAGIRIEFRRERSRRREHDGQEQGDSSGRDENRGKHPDPAGRSQL